MYFCITELRQAIANFMPLLALYSRSIEKDINEGNLIWLFCVYVGKCEFPQSKTINHCFFFIAELLRIFGITDVKRSDLPLAVNAFKTAHKHI